MCPSPYLCVVVSRAELVQPRVGVEVAARELPGVAHRLGLAGAVAERVVAIAVLDRACASTMFYQLVK